ncbi:MAG: response regulator transcription factor [Firmicutes bacterium]|nr:response regulator transcription factor [Bacillota bacterium]
MRLNIAVIDDLESDRRNISEYIDSYFTGKNIGAVHTEPFGNAEGFLKVYRKGEFQIVFLDICMDEMNGLDLADRLRKGDRNIAIIFMSTTRDFVFKSFPFQPKGYLCKPFEYEAFTEVMDRTLRDISAVEKFLKISIPHDEIEVEISEIFSVLSNNHSTEMKMITGEVYQCNMLFKEIEDVLEAEPNFLICNRGVIVNMDYTSQIKDDIIIMQDGTTYPIRRRGRKEIYAKFTKYATIRMRRRLDI